MTSDPPFDATAALQRLLRAFAAIPDSRQSGKVDHRLDEILAGSLRSMFCGFGHFISIAEFFRLQIDWLRGFLPLENGPPSHDAIRNAFLAVKLEALAESNEMEAIPRLLDSLQLKGATVTIDAAGCQTAIASQIDEAGAA